MSPDAIRERLSQIHRERLILADEYTVLSEALHHQGERGGRRSRYTPAQCGTESGYQRHRYVREQACDACRLAHNHHERISAARRRVERARDAVSES